MMRCFRSILSVTCGATGFARGRPAWCALGSLGLAAALLATPSAARRPPLQERPERVCAFRAMSVQNLLEADSQAALTLARLAAADLEGARRAAKSAARALRREAKHVRSGRELLGAAAVRSHRRTVAALLRSSGATLRAAARKAGVMSGVARDSARAANAAVATALDEVLAAGCVPRELRVTRFLVPEGTEHRLGPGLEILAAEGIEVAGTLVVDATSVGGEFRLTAEDGDLVVPGKILVRDHPAVVPARSSLRARATGAAATAPAGVSLVLTARAPSRNIVMGRFTLLQSGRGRDALDTVFHQGDARFEAEGGGNGGDIVLRAPLGTIRLAPLLAGNLAPFGLGDGGRGSSITVDRLGFDTAEITQELVGGRGGDSGRAVFEAARVENVPTAGEAITGPLLIEGGKGGNGGNVLWDNTELGLDGGGAPLDRSYPLQEIIVQGGAGGDGARQGGKGGGARYHSQRAINAVRDRIASASAYGGNGGDVFASPFPVPITSGGEGGEFAVEGNDGWDGGVAADGSEHADGADGGDVLGQGGDGGSILGDADSLPLARGGDGGNSRAAEARFPGVEFSDVSGVVAGYGGHGRDKCSGAAPGPGGAGGESGKASAYGGAGGNAPDGGVFGGDGGWGGNLWVVHAGSGGTGGDGDPPGAPGCRNTAIVAELGEAGAGVQPGEHGTPRGEIYGVPVCARAGETCSGGTTTTTTPGSDPTTTTMPDGVSCHAPSDYTYSWVSLTPNGDGTFTERSEEGVGLSFTESGAVRMRVTFCAFGTCSERIEIGSSFGGDHCSPEGDLHPTASGVTRTDRYPSGVTFTHRCTCCAGTLFGCQGAECFELYKCCPQDGCRAPCENWIIRPRSQECPFGDPPPTTTTTLP